MKKYILTVLFASATLFTTFAQAGKEKTPALIKSKNFTFYATSASPQYSAELDRVLRTIPGSTGSKVSLNPVMSQLEIKPDTISAYLPYFGRSQGVITSIDPDDQGIKFESTDYSYTEVQGKRGNRTITIIINDDKDRPKLILDISSTGYATLGVTFNSRSQISFNGYVEKTIPPRKKKS